MKYLLVFLLIVLLAGCSNPAGRAMRRMTQCCTNIPLGVNKLPARTHATSEMGGTVASSIFDPEMQLIHTW